MPIDLPVRRRIRLPRAAYADATAVCSVTVAVNGRVSIFADIGTAEFLRRSDAIEDAIRYVHENPVRGGMVDATDAYPFSSAWKDDGLAG